MALLRLVNTPTPANPNVHDIYLDESGQVVLIGDDITDIESYALAIAQRIKCRILLIRGEWYLDQRVGTPWKEQLLGRGVTADRIRRVLREVVLKTPGVAHLRSLKVSIDAQSRTATVTELVVVTDTRAVVTVAQLDTPMVLEMPHG